MSSVFKFLAAVVLVCLWASINQTVNGATFDSFMLSHTIDPDAEKGINSWDKKTWETWLDKRNKEFLQYCLPRKCPPLTDKPINSIIVGSRSEVEKIFANKNTLPKRAGGFYWSRNTIPIYVFKTNVNKKGKSTKIYRCGPLYSLAKLDNQGRPYHFHGMSDKQETTGNINYSVVKNCQLVS